ncbi:MAG: T9SS type A sorting domain-containing protein [Bacillota bacterium]
MKRALLCIFFLCCLNLFSQTVKWHNPQGGIGGTTRFDYLSAYGAPDGNIYVSAGEGTYSLYISEDNGNFWKSSPDHLTNSQIKLWGIKDIYICTNGKRIASLLYYNIPIAVAQDSANSWKYVINGLPDSLTVNKITSDSLNNIFIATDKGIFFLADKDTNWIKKSKSLPDSIKINTILITKSGAILAGTSSNGILRSSDGGNSWNYISSSLTGKKINSFTLNKKGYVFSGTENGVFISKDNGLSWNNAGSGLNAGNCQFLLVNSEDKLFVYNASKIYQSPDYGQYWYPLNSQINDTVSYITYMTISSKDYIAAIGQNGISKLWISSSPVTGVNDNANKTGLKSFVLNQNYPNPFNPETIISYSIPKGLNVRLKIYDMLGKEVAALVDEFKSAGSYSVQFNASSLPSGLYIYTIQAGEYKDSKKLMLLK